MRYATPTILSMMNEFVNQPRGPDTHRLTFFGVGAASMVILSVLRWALTG